MKKILYTLITTLLLISCHDDEMISNVPSSKDEGKLVELKVSLHIPDMQKSNSRAFGEGSLDYFEDCRLQMVVFDGNGYLKEFLNVIPTPAENDITGIYAITKDETNNEIDFKVRLHEAVSKRIIHVIVNSPQDSYEFGDESTLISNLSVSLNSDLSGNDTYWQRVELPNIIEKTTPTSLSRIPMIRNFAKITVSPNPDRVTVPNGVSFTYKGFVVMNVWNKGTVAPYQGNGGFAQLNKGEEMNSYQVIKDEKNYEGIWPSDANLVYNDIDKVDTDAHPLIMNTTSGLTPFYMYERRNTYVSNDIPSTYILVKANYGGADCWYKLDLVHDVDAQGKMITDPDNQTVVGKQYYNIIRNFHYAITIDAVTGAGYSTAEEASRRPAGNNLSGSVDIRDLTNISDAVNRLFVSYTDITLVNDGSYNNTKKLQATIKYKYVGANNIVSNDDVIITELPIDVEEDCLVKFQKANADENGWRTVTVTFDSDKLPSSYLDVFTNKLQFSKNGLSREVDFNIRGIIPMIVECKPSKVPRGVKQQVAANILIPNGITLDNDPYQLFPLEFWVEAEELTISPDVVRNKAAIKQSPYEMPVASGTSIIPSKAAVNKQTFRYKRTITYEEYNNLELKTVNYTTDVDGNTLSTPITGDYKVIPCYFLTNTTNSESKVYAQNELFTLRRVGEFTNDDQDIKNATLTDTGIYGIGQTATLTFTAVTAGTGTATYTITSGNLNESRSVSKEVTLENNGTTTITLYTATWDKTSMATIKAPDGTEYDVMAEARKELPMKATTTLNGASFTAANSPTFQVYTDQTSALAWADNKVTDVTNSALTSPNGTSKEIAGLKENTELWFAFQSGGFVYVASTTAGALAAKNAVLAFTNDNRVEIPLEMSAEFGNGTQYYGIGKTFEMTFTTNKPGTYTLTSNTLTFVSESNGITVNNNNQFVIEAAGEYKFTCTTTTWSDVASVTITRNGEEDKVLPVTGAEERLWFKFGNMTGGSNKPDNDQNITVYGTDGTVYGTVKWSALDNGTAELKIESIKNISDPINGNLCYFQYTKTEWVNNGTNYRPNWQQITYTYKTNVQQIPQAGGSTTLNFQEQN